MGCSRPPFGALRRGEPNENSPKNVLPPQDALWCPSWCGRCRLTARQLWAIQPGVWRCSGLARGPGRPSPWAPALGAMKRAATKVRRRRLCGGFPRSACRRARRHPPLATSQASPARKLRGSPRISMSHAAAMDPSTSAQSVERSRTAGKRTSLARDVEVGGQKAAAMVGAAGRVQRGFVGRGEARRSVLGGKRTCCAAHDAMATATSFAVLGSDGENAVTDTCGRQFATRQRSSGSGDALGPALGRHDGMPRSDGRKQHGRHVLGQGMELGRCKWGHVAKV